jgi:hypothetical protein
MNRRSTSRALRRLRLTTVLFAILAISTAGVAADKPAKPKLSLRASPSVSFSPARIFLVVEIKGGPNDFEEFYCATAEWDWGDGTTSESSYDCEPYEAGKSEMRRRYSTEHKYLTSGYYQIQFRLKKKNKPVALVHTVVQIRPGLRDIGQ